MSDLPPEGAWIPSEHDEAWGGGVSPEQWHEFEIRTALDHAAATAPATLPEVFRRYGMPTVAAEVESALREAGVIRDE